MNIIIFQEGYDPHPDPNSVCTKAIVDVFKEQGDNVYVVCDGEKGKERLFSDDKSIIHVKVGVQKTYYQKNILGKIVTLFSRVLSIPIWPIRFPRKVKNYVKTAEQLLASFENNQQTIMISVYRPAEMVSVGYEMKKHHTNIPWIVYSLDGIGSMVNLKNSKWLDKKELRWNVSHCAFADYIIQMKSHRETYLNSPYAKYIDKTIFLDLPLIIKKPDRVDTKENINHTTTFVYGGAFYKNLREPFYMLSWFKKLAKYKADIKFLCYSRSQFIKDLDKATEDTEGKFRRYDYIAPEEMERVIEQSNFVINIGNAASPLVPSKLFIYISACKPIIHFISDMNDSCLSYLKKYPLSLVINQNDSVDKSVKKTLEFIDSIKNQNITFQDIVTSFQENTPEYTVNCINKIIIK